MDRTRIAFAVLAASAPIRTASAASTTITVKGINHDGTITINFLDKNGNSSTLSVGVDPSDGESGVASNIAKAIGNGATSSGGKVSIPAPNGIKISDPNGALKQNLNDDLAFAPGIPGGLINFDPDLLTGNTILLADSTMTAGFTFGLPAVSVAATTGETLDELTASLDSALTSAGYVTSLIGADQIEFFGNGASGSTEFDFSLQPNVAGSDTGIAIGIASAPVPEISSPIMLGIGVLILALLMARNPRSQTK